MSVALVFPGQGSQVPGMAAAWRDTPAFGYWARADELLGTDVTRLGLKASAEELREPATCQRALFVHHAVLLKAWRAAAGTEPVAVAGHSLGEYDALLAAGVLGFDELLGLVDVRARATSAAAQANPGTMVACLGYPVEEVAQACDRVGAHVANDNAPGQIVVAGSAEALQRLRDELVRGATGAKGKVRDVEVGAAYHSPHMQAAVAPLEEALQAVVFTNAAVPVVANVDAQPHSSAPDWPSLLREQVVSPVRWREAVATLAQLGATEVVELCASPVLSGLVKRTDPSLGRVTVRTPDDLP